MYAHTMQYVLLVHNDYYHVCTHSNNATGTVGCVVGLL